MSNRVAIDLNVHLPMPVVLAGVIAEGKPTFMTVGFISRVNYKPPMLGMGIGDIHYTPNAIKEAKCFSICVPGKDLLIPTDYCGLVSAKRTDKSTVFKTTPGPETGAPLIDDCPLVMECSLEQAIQLDFNTLFIGKIVSAFCNDDCLTDGHPDTTKIDPLLLTMPDNRYWTIGEQAGKAWHDGKAMKQK